MKTKRWLWVIVGFVNVILAAFLGLAIVSLFMAGIEKPATLEIYDGEADVNAVILYADTTQFHINETKKVQFTVRIPWGIEGESFDIVDANGNIIVSQVMEVPAAESDQYREYTAQVDIALAQTGITSYKAVIGKDESDFLNLYCTTDITEEMINKCMDIGVELQDYVDAQGLEDGDHQVCLESVLKWLENDERVLDAAINEDSVVYTSVDHVAGIYNLPAEEGYLGFFGSDDDEEENVSVGFEDSEKVKNAFERYMDTGYASYSDGTNVYLNSKNADSNKSFLVLRPIYTDKQVDDSLLSQMGEKLDADTVSVAGRNHEAMGEKFESELGYSVNTRDNIEAFNEIIEGRICNHSVVTMICHGGHNKRSDGTYLSTYNFGVHGSGNELWTALVDACEDQEGFYSESEFYDLFFQENALNVDHTLFTLQGRSVHMTSNYIVNRYQNLFFDNTVVYFGACYGMIDDRMVNFLISHGVKATMGYHVSMNTDTEKEIFDDFFNSMLKVKSNGNRKNIEESSWGNAVATKGWNGFWYGFGNLFYDEADKLIPEGQKFNLYITAPNMGFTFEGYGDLSGKVEIKKVYVHYDENGKSEETEMYETGSGLELMFHRFSDQAFNDEWLSVNTEEDGSLRIEDMKWGIYGIWAEDDMIVDTAAGVTFTNRTFNGGMLELTKWGASYEAPVAIEDGDELEMLEEAKVKLVLVEAFAQEDEGEVNKEYITMTNDEGMFYFEEMPGGMYTIEITHDEGSYNGTLELKNGYEYVHENAFLLSGGKVINNGGRFVGYKDNVYYWQMSSASLEQTGLFGSFGHTQDTNSRLICRKSDGSEEVLLRDEAYGGIYICGDRLFYQKEYMEWAAVDLDGSNKTTYPDMSIVGADTKTESIVYVDYEDYGLYVLQKEKNQKKLASGETSYLGIYEGKVYYAVLDETVYTIYGASLNGSDSQSLGTISVYQPDSMTGIMIGDVYFEEDGIYIAYGTIGGTGLFFQGGGASRVDYDGGVETIVDQYSTECLMNGKIYIENSEQGHFLHYFTGNSMLGVDLWNDQWANNSVKKVDLNSGKVSDSSLVLSDIGDIVYEDKCIQTLLDSTGQYQIILSQEMLSSIGYSKLGVFDSGDAAYVPYMDIIGDIAYITITKVYRDDDVSLGWRQGYRRGNMQVYAVSIGSGEMELLHEY